MSNSEHPPPWLEGISGDFLPRLIESDAPVIEAVAGPGSGKTLGLRRRVQRLIDGKGIEPDRIFVGTFTRAIAADLSRSVGEKVWVLTLHSLAFKLLRENPGALGGRQLRFLLRYEEDVLLHDVGLRLPDAGDVRERRRTLTRLQSAWAERRALPDARFAGEVDRWLREHGGMLIGEVVPLATRALQAHDIQPGQFDEVIVDEYQDLTACEQEMVELIWSGNGSLVVLGDDNQSIYSFRHNHPRGVSEFAERWADRGIDQIEIPENRRSGSAIVELANVVMAEAGGAAGPMIPRRDELGDAALVHWESVDDEIAGLATYIRARADKQFLVLVPRRYIGHRLQQLVGPDARTAFHQEVLEHALLQERFSLAGILANPEDRVAQRSWFGMGGPAQNADRRNSEAVASLPQDPSSAIALARSLVAEGVQISGSGRGNVLNRARMLLDLVEAAPDELGELINFLFDPALAADLEVDEEKRKWLEEDLDTLRGAAHQLREQGEDSLAKIMGRLRYRIATRMPLTEDDVEPRVRIMTLHSAKGLEADAIIVAGLADQIVPGPPPAHGDPSVYREEQRRLLYVAITRARMELVVSWPRTMKYAHGPRLTVRRDSVITRDDEQLFVLTRSTLLPGHLRAEEGRSWLQQQGIRAD